MASKLKYLVTVYSYVFAYLVKHKILKNLILHLKFKKNALFYNFKANLENNKNYFITLLFFCFF